MRVIDVLKEEDDPVQKSRSWSRSYNCEEIGMRIRLDNSIENMKVLKSVIEDDSELEEL